MTIHKPLQFLVLLTLLIAGASKVKAGDWTRHDTMWEATWQVVNVIDYGQTIDISRQCADGGVQEINPLLGSCPSKRMVQRHFIAAAIGHAAISFALPAKYRPTWQYVTIAVSGMYVLDNFSIGLKVRF